MSTLWFPTVRRPSRSTKEKTEAKVMESQFGDGYTQRLGAGLNAVRGTIPMAWDVLPQAQATAIEQFLAARAGVESFLYQMPDETSPRKFTCQSWTTGWAGPALRSVSAEFRQEFDPT